MRCEKLGLVNNNGNYVLVNTDLFPYDKESNEECKQNLVITDILKEHKTLEFLKDNLVIGVQEIQGGYYFLLGHNYRSAIPISKETYDFLKEELINC